MSTLQSRRDFLKKSTMLVGSAAILGGAGLLTGCTSASATTSTETPAAPAFPYEYPELDATLAEEVAYGGYFEDGCCYGVAKAMLEQLQASVGYPFTAIDPAIYKPGKEGYGIGTICGALAGAVNVISMVVPTDDAKAINAELFNWYTSTSLPLYRPEGLSDVQTVAKSINCSDSVTQFKQAANVEQADPIRKERCGAISGDVARKAVELLNIHYGYMAAPEPAPEKTMAPLADNEYLGESSTSRGAVKVKVTMDGDKISNIEVLENNETPSFASEALVSIPESIIANQSADIDVIANATETSNAIMEAVKDALSKVK